jgi:pilus assembly protein Flp/PilA
MKTCGLAETRACLAPRLTRVNTFFPIVRTLDLGERRRATATQTRKKMNARLFREFLSDEGGVTAIEYALIAALVAVVIIVGATALGVNINDLFNYIADKIGATVPEPPAEG